MIQILDHTLKFVHEREHPEGGFTLYEGIPDTKNTYYGVKILQMLDEEPHNKENTIKWIENLQDGRQYGTRGIFYRLNILDVYKRNPKFPQKYVKRFVIESRPIGLLKMICGGEQDDKVLSVPVDDPKSGHIKNIDDLPESLLNEIVHFFQEYKRLEGKSTEILGWEDYKEALKVVEHSIMLYKNKIGSKF